MKVRSVRVGQLRVSDWYECERCHEVYLKNVPIKDCPYYRCLQEGNESIHEQYVQVAKKRFPNYLSEKRYTYGHLMRLAFKIAMDGWDPSMGKGNEAMRVSKDSTLLADGHHRAAILLVIHGSDYSVDVEELDDPEIPSEHRCAVEV